MSNKLLCLLHVFPDHRKHDKAGLIKLLSSTRQITGTQQEGRMNNNNKEENGLRDGNT